MAGCLLLGARPARAGDDPTERAREAYEMGIKLFEAGQNDLALLEFQSSFKAQQVPATLFMMAQCEYLTGKAKLARTHYELYVEQDPQGRFVELARRRIQAIDELPSTFAINTDPQDVQVTIRSAAGRTAVTGVAPNNFVVPRAGRYTLTLTKPNYLGITREVDIDLAESKPLFFKLAPIPAHLEIITRPPDAALFINGNRAKNPYKQDVPPGRYEIYAEAPEHRPLTLPSFELGPGERKLLAGEHGAGLPLPYVQANGRFELIGWSTFVAGVIGGGAVLAVLSPSDRTKPNPASGTLIGGGVAVGAVSGALGGTLLAPAYIPDNRALFAIGGMWMGVVEGGAVGFTVKGTLPAAVVGGFAGGATGTLAAGLLTRRAPNYGRAAVIQSGALVGAFSGLLLRPALDRGDDYTGPFLLAGMNLGLLTGLGTAYLPDQRKYGPTWTRVVLVDLAVGAGAVAGAVIATVERCLPNLNSTTDCSFSSDARTARLTARFALGGTALGLMAGVLLTRNVGRQEADSPPEPTVEPPFLSAIPTAIAVDTERGTRLVPGLAAAGSF